MGPWLPPLTQVTAMSRPPPRHDGCLLRPPSAQAIAAPRSSPHTPLVHPSHPYAPRAPLYAPRTPVCEHGMACLWHPSCIAAIAHAPRLRDLSTIALRARDRWHSCPSAPRIRLCQRRRLILSTFADCLSCVRTIFLITIDWARALQV